MPSLSDYLTSAYGDFTNGLGVVGDGARNLPGNFVRGVGVLQNTYQNGGAGATAGQFLRAAGDFQGDVNEAAGQAAGDVLGYGRVGARMIGTGGRDPWGSTSADLQYLGMPQQYAAKVGPALETVGDPSMALMGLRPTPTTSAEARATGGVAEAAGSYGPQSRNITLDSIANPKTTYTAAPPPPPVATEAPSAFRQAVQGLGQDILGFARSETGTPPRLPQSAFLDNTAYIRNTPTGPQNLGRQIAPGELDSIMKEAVLASEEAKAAGGTNFGFAGQTKSGPLIYDTGVDPTTLPHEAKHIVIQQGAARGIDPAQMPDALSSFTARLKQSNIPQARGAGAFLDEINARAGEGPGAATKWMTDPAEAYGYAQGDFKRLDPTGTAAWLNSRTSSKIGGAAINALSQVPTPVWQSLKYGAAAIPPAYMMYNKQQGQP